MIYILEAIRWKVLAGLTVLQWYVYASIVATLVRLVLEGERGHKNNSILGEKP